MKIAIIILNFNSSGDCRKCIANLKGQTGVETEIIVVDNCSREDERLAAEIVSKNSGCTFIANPENRGYNAGNNIGLRYAAKKGFEYALICNPDMQFPQRDYLAKLTAILHDHDEVAIAASDILHYDGYHQNPLNTKEGWALAWQRLKQSFLLPQAAYSKNNHLVQDSGYCRMLSGCCFVIRMSFLKAINFFDEHTFLYTEEAILAKQAKIMGCKLYYYKEAQAIHNHIKKQKGNPIPHLTELLRSRIYYERYYSEESLASKIAVVCAYGFFSLRLIVAYYPRIWMRKIVLFIHSLREVCHSK